jgi:hypothetical protein
MLTINGIEKMVHFNTFLLGDTNKNYERWEVVDVTTLNNFYIIDLKCIACAPLSGMLGLDIHITLYRFSPLWNKKPIPQYEIHCAEKNKQLMITKEDMSSHGAFTNTILKLLND